jgi:phospholipid/cholesterol/gamma-HCH transport system substrate-binding protein
MTANNSNRESALELKAGVFVLIGLVFIAVMAFKFGRLGQGLFQHYYDITATFPSADGLIKNSDVQLAGARIGYVADKPVITPGGSGVTVPLKILAGVNIPREATFTVQSSGLLGDKFVDITPTAKFDAAAFNPADPKQVIAAGESVAGVPPGGLLGTLQGPKGEEVFDNLDAEVKKLTEVTNKINTGILSEENQKNITETFANLQVTSENFSVASKDLDAVVKNAESAIDAAKTTMGTVNGAAGDVRTALATAEKTLESAQGVIAKAQTGDGPVATLLNNRQLSDNLKALVENLREHGILFYKNKAGAATAGAGGQVPSESDERLRRQN